MDGKIKAMFFKRSKENIILPNRIGGILYLLDKKKVKTMSEEEMIAYGEHEWEAVKKEREEIYEQRNCEI